MPEPQPYAFLVTVEYFNGKVGTLVRVARTPGVARNSVMLVKGVSKVLSLEPMTEAEYRAARGTKKEPVRQ